ncbi:mechanosensitive ion channel family protein [Desulfopila aestuarii]|uniref:Small-conductance mechanosensitive channel n=1 Tax=Desulfopila aestuarii DSM 18488 TaxID=1121416 RepID=A0A1M7YII5_9BACT|nr:mechanosensitive ion channel family protein [Desulfopila aestuarii]SHO52454.1 Small-conductance mechanosensitive channel [Desulfopila aestuarii DSM 18488]
MQIQRVARHLTPLILVILVVLGCSDYSSASQPAPTTVSQTDVTARVAGLSDEEARKLLISELEKTASQDETLKKLGPDSNSPLARLLNVLDTKSDVSEQGTRQLLQALPKVGADLSTSFRKLCPYNTSTGAMENLLWVLFFLATGIIIELLFVHLVVRRIFANVASFTIPTAITGVDKLIASITQELPNFLRLLIYFCGSYVIFVSFIWTDSPNVQMFFLAILILSTLIRAFAILTRMFLSPQSPLFRIAPINCHLAGIGYRALLITFSYILTVMMFGIVLKKLGLSAPTLRLYFLFNATFLLSATGACILFYRKQVADAIIQSPSEYGECASWGRNQFAAIWHLLALAYLVLLWILLFNDIIDPAQENRGAFLLSFFVVPIWMVSDKLLQWLVKYAMATLKIHLETYEDSGEVSEADILQREQGKKTFMKTMTVARTGLVILILIWIAGLWNIYIPVFSNLSGVVFDTLIILTVAIIFWQFISNWIEQKIEESLPADKEKKEDEDDWGASANRGRSYTLLPMLRKFIGTILVTMVTMTILSSMGVDIGPLLAGAGVVGLAVGFGAQKLVADMFSGFFYLLDDAFRVGEYIEAGGITGTVENISLRNVMLRHHRGMLQIVPHSDLGPITNYMRGGLIVKFNLDFPYDAEIDQIRKIIKKVGQAMQEDEEFKNDFIRPLKSQGVREITNSVMTIRVKFTAKPGAHFLIRREAYKRITEALRAKGIHYAHRKVIVDIPSQPGSTEEHIASAAGAATGELIQQEEQKAAEASTRQK